MRITKALVLPLVLLAGLAEISVVADHPDFAARHRDLLLCLMSEVQS